MISKLTTIICPKIIEELISVLEKKCCFCDMNGIIKENCALLGYYAARVGNFFPTFQDSLSVPASRVECELTFK